MINNPFMPTTRFNSYIARGGGGGEGGEGGDYMGAQYGTSTPTSTPTPTTTPAPTFTSTYPELEGKTYATETERTAAETAVGAERAKAASLAQYQADVGTAVSGVDTTGMDEIAKQQAYTAAAQGVEAGEGADVDATANWLKEQQAMYSGAGQAAALESQLKTSSGQREMATASVSDPASLTATADVATIDQNAPGTTVADTVGQLGGAAPTITDPDAFNAAAVDPTKATGQVAAATDAVQTVQGEVSPDATIKAAQSNLSPEAIAKAAGFDDTYIQQVVSGQRKVSQQELIKAAKAANIPVAEAAKMLGGYVEVDAAKFGATTPEAEAQDVYTLTPTQVAKQSATTVQDAAKVAEMPTAEAATSSYQSTLQAAQGQVGYNELVNARDILATEKAVTAVAATVGAVNQDAIATAATGSFSQAALAKAALGAVPAKATVQGQMAELMSQFDNGTPAWAAGAMRAANALMASRGLGGSSMAGAAVVQAAMESAVPIAQNDANTFAQMNMQNLSNRQQVSLANAAAQQNMDLSNLSNEQQVRLQNSTNAFSLQSQNLNNEQAVVLANAQFKAALQNKSIDVKTQTSLANAAKFAEKANINLSNQQQAAIIRSAENLQVELSNLSNEQAASLANLQVRAALVGQELSNEQQVAMLKSTQDFGRAQFDASAKNNAFLQDAQASAAMEGKAMDIRQQTQLFNIGAQLEERQLELSNEQQTRLFNSTNKVNISLEEMSNRQQVALANAQIEATLVGKELDIESQTRVLNAAKFAEAANMTFTAEQNAALHNSTLMANIGSQVMNAENAAVLQNAAAAASMDMANLSNRQQAAVMNAQSFLQMDMKNMDFEQQTELFKAQSNIQAIFSDQAADNAAKQFNASSENQTNQFFATMSQQVQQFNAGMEVQRDQFNAQNALIVAQANAQWRQNATTIDTAAQNQANADAAMQTNQMTQNMVDTLWQRERDIMDYAFRQSENESDRALSVFLADKQVELAEWQTSQANKQADKEGKGYLVSRLLFG